MDKETKPLRRLTRFICSRQRQRIAANIAKLPDSVAPLDKKTPPRWAGPLLIGRAITVSNPSADTLQCVTSSAPR